MKTPESSYPADWLRIAEKDWARVKRLLEQKDPELAAFCLQQSLEKFLKAYLLSKGWTLRRTHDLEALLDEASAHDAALEAYRAACQRITNFYVVERYPLTDFTVAEEDVRASHETAEPFVERLRKALS